MYTTRILLQLFPTLRWSHLSFCHPHNSSELTYRALTPYTPINLGTKTIFPRRWIKGDADKSGRHPVFDSDQITPVTSVSLTESTRLRDHDFTFEFDMSSTCARAENLKLITDYNPFIRVGPTTLNNDHNQGSVPTLLSHKSILMPFARAGVISAYNT